MERQQTSRLVLISLLVLFEGLEAVSGNNHVNSFMGMNCLPAIAKSPCKVSVYRMSAHL